MTKRVPDQYIDLYPSSFDYGLTAISGVLTAYSAGMAVASPTVGYIFVVLSLLGVWISYTIMRAVRGERLAKVNGAIYALGVFSAFMLSRILCEMLPENPFKAQIALCGALCWMLVFGSFLIWSDQTILFQAVPCIAIFGLVGCYDTYRNATWMFFGFLLCFATLLARVHGRTMLRQAKESGYSQTGERMDRSATELERMRTGPWKWVAGPQWALGSAFAVILFSFVGAPIIRESVQGVTINVAVQSPASAAGRSAGLSAQDTASTRVGRGPNELSNLPVLRATLDRPRYLRTNVYQTYNGGAWIATGASSMGEDTNTMLAQSAGRMSITALQKAKLVEYEIEPLTGRLNVLPIPGEVVKVDPSEGTTIREDGTLAIAKPGTISVFRGRSLVAEDEVRPVTGARKAPKSEQILATEGIQSAVFDLANRVAKEGKTDFERAQLIKAEIERRAMYNLRAAAAPDGKDPVEYFLFEGKEGYCDLFASSMVLMARSVGIPARYVVGYFPINGERDGSNRYVIAESERHAWAELFFNEGGWVVFDPTEGAVAVEGNERGQATSTGLANSIFVKRALDILIGVGVLVILGFGARILLRNSKGGLKRSELDREYLKFAGLIERATGKARRFDQTPFEYATDAAPMLNGSAEIAMRITRMFEKMLYSSGDPNVEDVKRLQTEIAAFRNAVRGNRSKVA